MAKKQKGELTDENSIAIFPEKPVLLRVEKPQADIGFLYMEINGKDAGRIVFRKTKGKLGLMFNQTVFGLENRTKAQRARSLVIRGQICEKLGGTDVTYDLYTILR